MQNKRILVVDDEEALRRSILRHLKKTEALCFEAGNGEEALATLGETKPDLILLDIMMPKINGFDVLRELKSDAELQSIPVIILTALIQDVDRVQGKKLGAADYIVKSETMPGEVIVKIKNAIGQQ